MYPPNWTTIKPEFDKGYWPLWTGEDWKYEEDHRGQEVWKSYNELVTITKLGPIPDEYSVERPSRVYTQAEKIKMYEDVVQGYLDYTAQQKGYDNTYTCLSYLNSSDPIWKAEAEVFNVWRDQVWRKCHELLNRYLKGEIGEISFEELQKELPVIQWPSTELGPEDSEPDVSEEEISPEQPVINETETELTEENSDSKKETTDTGKTEETEKPVAEVTEEK